MMPCRRYHIRIQIRTAYNGCYPTYDWRAYRQFAVWPILFDTRQEAENFMDECFTFRNIPGRKHSASVEACVIR